MKTAKLFVEGSEYCDIEYLNYRYLGHCVDLNLQSKVDLSEYNDGDSFEWHLENESGDIVISGMATVNYTPSVTIKEYDEIHRTN